MIEITARREKQSGLGSGSGAGEREGRNTADCLEKIIVTFSSVKVVGTLLGCGPCGWANPPLGEVWVRVGLGLGLASRKGWVGTSPITRLDPILGFEAFRTNIFEQVWGYGDPTCGAVARSLAAHCGGRERTRLPW